MLSSSSKDTYMVDELTKLHEDLTVNSEQKQSESQQSPLPKQ